MLNSTNLAIFILFADDTNIFVTDKCLIEAYKKANVVLQAINRYMSANKLHINLSKCCYIHFKPKSSIIKNSSSYVVVEDKNSNLNLSINNIQINQVKQTKFLGVIVDDCLSWAPHIDYLSKKLRSATGILSRIKDNIPSSMHKSLYHTLFESHLTYGISVWGGAKNKKLIDMIYIIQKKCIRILFGDKSKFLSKFETCVRARPVGNQVLGSNFYEKEHTKPLFSANKILTVQHLYHYFVIFETFKILKTHTPISMFSCFQVSGRKETLLITPVASNNFIFKACSLWNCIRRKLDIAEFSIKFSDFKSTFKTYLQKQQSLGNAIEWSPENFMLQ